MAGAVAAEIAVVIATRDREARLAFCLERSAIKPFRPSASRW